MASLQNEQIDLSYSGLIKTTDNAALGAVEKEITDGVGTASTLKLGTTSASFVGTLDLTGATVTGLPPGGVSSIIAGSGISVDTATGDVTVSSTGGSGGLVAGTVAGSIKSADSLTVNPSVSSKSGNIAIGSATTATGSETTAMGINSDATGEFSIAVGRNANATGYMATAFGNESTASGGGYPFGSLAIGSLANASFQGAIAIGNGNASAANAIIIGKGSNANATGAVALGAGVTAAIADTVSVKQLELQTVGGGIIMKSPNGTAYKLTVSDAGAPVFTAV